MFFSVRSDCVLTFCYERIRYDCMIVTIFFRVEPNDFHRYDRAAMRIGLGILPSAARVFKSSGRQR